MTLGKALKQAARKALNGAEHAERKVQHGVKHAARKVLESK